jgi:hypothetical protein
MRPFILIPLFILSCTKLKGGVLKASSPKVVMKDGFQAQAFSGSCASKQNLIQESVAIKDGKILFSKMKSGCQQKISFDLKFAGDDILVLTNPKFVEPCGADAPNVSLTAKQYFKVKIMESNIIQFHPMMGGYCRSVKVTQT